MTTRDDLLQLGRRILAEQPFSVQLGAELTAFEPGRAELRLTVRPDHLQQHGFVHGGVVGMIADSAAGYAAMTMVPAAASVLTVEYKMNLMAPADGDHLVAHGRVIRAGRTLIVTQGEVFAVKDGQETQCALMQQTIMVMHGKTEKLQGERT